MKKLPSSSIVLLGDGLHNQLGSHFFVCSIATLTALYWKHQLTDKPPVKPVPWGQKCICPQWIRVAISSHLTFLRHWIQRWLCWDLRHESASAAFLGGWYVWNCLVILTETSSFSSCSGESPFDNVTRLLPSTDADAAILQDSPNFMKLMFSQSKQFAKYSRVITVFY